MSNRNGVWSLPAQYQAIADQDWTMAPGAPTGVSATAGNAQAEVSFTAPTFAGIPGTITQFKVTSSEGETATGSASPITVSSLTNGTAHTFTVQAQNAIGLGKASDASSSVTPLAEIVDGLFSTHLYIGTGSTITNTNNINLSGKGGMTWIKCRNAGVDHSLFDTARTGQYRLETNTNSTQEDQGAVSWTPQTTGFTIGGDGGTQTFNANNDLYVSWTFRKEPKFFDVVTWSGDGSGARAISHSLGSVPGMYWVKRYDGAEDWRVFHRRGNGGTNDEQYVANLHTNAGFSDSDFFNDTAPTSTQFTVGSGANISSRNYVAYLFAHNNNDGGFGAAGEDIIKCDEYTGNGSSSGNFINVGFEPQFVLIKNRDTGTSADWVTFDNMRGVRSDHSTTSTDDLYLFPNGNNSEGGGVPIDFNATGFTVFDTSSRTNANGNNFIYMAVRRGGTETPTAGSDVFAVNAFSGDGNDDRIINAGFPVDMVIHTRRGASGTNNNYVADRLRMGNAPLNLLYTNSNSAEVQNVTDRLQALDHSAGFEVGTEEDGGNQGGSTYVSWMWKRAKGYFDMVSYKGTGSTQNISHNLGVAPEMMWIKKISGANNWKTFHTSLGAGYSMELNSTTYGENNGSALWNSTAPTSSVFTVGSAGDVNSSSHTYIAYLFASVTGVSKIGSYTGNGSTQTIDCGFNPRFILTKKSVNGNGGWLVFDTERGIVSGNDPYILLNTTDAEQTGADTIDLVTNGFTVNDGNTNSSGDGYIFYAIA